MTKQQWCENCKKETEFHLVEGVDYARPEDSVLIWVCVECDEEEPFEPEMTL